MKAPHDARNDAALIVASCLTAGVAAWLLGASLHISAWRGRSIERIAVFAPIRGLAVAILVSLAATILLVRAGRPAARSDEGSIAPVSRRARIVTPLLALWVLAVPYLPWLSDVLPLLTILAGPVRWVLVLATVATVAVRWLRSLQHSPAWRVPARPLVFVTCAALYVACGLYSNSVAGVTGDEPHYLVITQSLLADQDLQIGNNHERRDYRYFYAGELRPDSIRRGRNGEIYPNKAPGLPAMLLPGYRLAAVNGAIVTVALLGALGALAIFDIGRRMGGVRAGWVVWAGTCFTIPVVPHAWSIFPEIAAFAVCAWTVSWLIEPIPAPRPIWVLRGASLALLPWLHTRFAVLFAALVVFAVSRLWTRKRDLSWFLSPAAVLVFAWLAHFYVIYGTFDPRAPWGGGSNSAIRLAHVPRGTAGLVLDQKFGLLLHAPFLALSAAGFVWLLRDAQWRTRVLLLGGAIATYLVSSTQMYTWWGGTSAPGRFFVAAIPLTVPLLAAAVARGEGTAFRAILWTSFGLTLLASAVGVAHMDRRILFSDPHGLSEFVRLVQGPAPLVQALPVFTEHAWPLPPGAVLAWLAAAGAALGVAVAGARLRGASVFSVAVASSFSLLLIGAALVPPFAAGVRAETVLKNRLHLMERYDPEERVALSLRTFAPLADQQWLRSAGIVLDRETGHSADRTGRFGPPLSLPAGSYEMTVWFSSGSARLGDLQLTLVRGQLLARHAGPLGNPATVTFDLPMEIPAAWIQVSDPAAAQEISRATLSPRSILPASDRPRLDIRAVETVAGRSGSYVVYTGGGSYPSRDGTFWTKGRETARLLVRPGTVGRIVMDLHTGPLAQVVRVRIGGREHEVTVQPPQHAFIEYEVVSGADWIPIEVQAAASFRPIDVERGSFDSRRLGCYVRIEVREAADR